MPGVLLTEKLWSRIYSGLCPRPNENCSRKLALRALAAEPRVQGKAQVRKYATTQGIPRPEATALRLGLVRSKIGLQLPLHAARLDPMLNMDKSNERLDCHDERVVLKRHCYTLLHPIAPVSRFFFRRSSVRAWMFWEIYAAAGSRSSACSRSWFSCRSLRSAWQKPSKTDVQSLKACTKLKNELSTRLTASSLPGPTLQAFQPFLSPPPQKPETKPTCLQRLALRGTGPLRVPSQIDSRLPEQKLRLARFLLLACRAAVR